MWRSFSAKSYEGRCFASTQKFGYYLRYQHQPKQHVSYVQDMKSSALSLDGTWPAHRTAIRSSCNGPSPRPVSLLPRYGQPSRVISHQSFCDTVWLRDPRLSSLYLLIAWTRFVSTLLVICGYALSRLRETCDREMHFKTAIAKPQQPLYKHWTARFSYIHMQRLRLYGAESGI